MFYVDLMGLPQNKSKSACFNLTAEYFLALKRTELVSDTVFTVWQTYPTIMLGKYQNAYEEINSEYAFLRKLDIVRRMSGGGTIYTDEGGFQYCYITKNDSDEICFERFTRPVVDVLRKLLPHQSVEFSGRNDIILNGRKISGNAQYSVKGVTVHHGSMLFATDIEAMVLATAVDPEKFISKSIKSVRERVCNISEYTDMTIEDFIQAFIKGLTEALKTKTYQPSSDEIAEIDELVKSKFSGFEWIYGAFSGFDKKCSFRTVSGLFQLTLSVKHGVIEKIDIYSDCITNSEEKLLAKISELKRLLLGIKLDYLSIKSGLTEGGMSDFFGVTPSELAELLLK